MGNKMKKRVCGRVCCVPGCKSNSEKDKGKHFYSFPSREWETQRKKRWIISVRRMTPSGHPWEPTKNSRICSDHFVGGEKSNDPRKEAYNPTIFPWKPQNPLAVERSSRREQREKRKESTQQTSFLTSQKQSALLEDDPIAPQTCTEEVELPSLQTTRIFCPKPTVTKNIAVGPKLRYSDMRIGFTGFDDVRNDDTAVKQLTGVSLVFFSILLNFIQPSHPGQASNDQVLSRENRLLLFLMKMKLGLNFVALACIFKLSTTTVSIVFQTVLQTLYMSTITWIFWPSREANQKTIPETFKEHPNCRAIIIRTDLRCDTPPTVKQRACMYCSYKAAFTVKYLIAITPSGFISFVSNGFGGRTTDKQMVNESGILERVEPGDEIMATKYFRKFRTELMQRECTLVIPSAATNPEFPRNEAFERCSIAVVQIHVERVIQKVKIFKILDRINIELLPSIDKIMHMACVLANNEPLLINTE